MGEVKRLPGKVKEEIDVSLFFPKERMIRETKDTRLYLSFKIS